MEDKGQITYLSLTALWVEYVSENILFCILQMLLLQNQYFGDTASYLTYARITDLKLYLVKVVME